jgi:hypothetical protein
MLFKSSSLMYISVLWDALTESWTGAPNAALAPPPSHAPLFL